MKTLGSQNVTPMISSCLYMSRFELHRDWLDFAVYQFGDSMFNFISVYNSIEEDPISTDMVRLNIPTGGKLLKLAVKRHYGV